jgi:hypothetical protein
MDDVGAQYFASEVDRGKDGFPRKLWMTVDDLLGRLTCGKLFQNVLDSDPRTLYDGFPHHDFRVRNDKSRFHSIKSQVGQISLAPPPF